MIRMVLHLLMLVALFAASAAVAKPAAEGRGEAWRAQCQQWGGDLRGCCNELRSQCAQSCGGHANPCGAACQACNIQCNASMDVCVAAMRRPQPARPKNVAPNASRRP